MGSAALPDGGKRREYLVGFAVSSVSPALAAIVTNPIEVVKVRQQAGGAESARRGMASSLLVIGRTEGLAGLQAGLALAVVREASKAFFRIGCFQPILDAIHDPASGPAPAAKRMASGMSSGAIAALICNPIELVKTQQQGQTSFGYRGPLDGLRQLYKGGGLCGMWRGTGAPVTLCECRMYCTMQCMRCAKLLARRRRVGGPGAATQCAVCCTCDAPRDAPLAALCKACRWPVARR